MSSSIFYLILASTFIHAGWNLVARKVTGNPAVIWFALAFSSILLLPVVVYNHFQDITLTSISPVVYQYLFFSGVIHGFYYYLLGRIYEEGEISSVYPAARGASVSLAASFGFLFLGESLSIAGFCGIACVIFGIFLLGASSHFRGLSNSRILIMAIWVGVFSAGYSIVDKIAVAQVDAVLYLALSFPASAFFLYPFVRKSISKANLRKYWKPSAVIGLGIPLGYVFVLIAFQRGQLSYISAMREFSVVIGSLAGVAFFREHISILKSLGLGAITAGLIYLRIA